ncbi:MAG TPA: hypothetical protein VNJ01_02295 [Bacteriovoracaceae bacterium]|nr:hypothetical protein [Bacteriovoracaceae bacterium]
MLLSSQLLRSRNLGQIDLSKLTRLQDEWIIEIVEVKSSQLGAASMERIQKLRLQDSQRFVSAVFGLRSKLMNLVG